MEDLGLDVGTAINLELMLPRNPRCDVELIGYRRGQSVLVTVPEKASLAAAIYPGLEAVVRYLHGTRVAGFRTTVLHVSGYPFRYLHLRYPDNVDRVTVRRAERVKVHLPARVILAGNRPATAAAVMDLSVSGGLLLAQKQIGEVGDIIRVEFSVRFADAEHAVALDAVIRNQGRKIADEANAGGYYGVEFIEPSSEQKVLLSGFIYERLVSKRGAGETGA